MEAEISFAELDALTGELLPERAVLGLVNITINNAGPAGGGAVAPAPEPAQYVVTDNHGSTVYYACQTTHHAGTQGLIGATGLGQAPYTTTTCMPAAVTSRA